MSKTALQQITAKAKQLRKDHPKKKWTDLVKQASTELRKAGKIGAVKPYSKVRQTGSTNLREDLKRKAKPPGKRVVKHPGGKATVYYERRKNRSDKPGSLSGVGASTDYIVQRWIMKRGLTARGITVAENISDLELQRVYRQLTKKRVPSITKIRELLKKGTDYDTIFYRF